MLSKKSARLGLEKRRCFESILLLLCSRCVRVSLLFNRRRIKERARAINERRSVLSLRSFPNRKEEEQEEEAGAHSRAKRMTKNLGSPFFFFSRSLFTLLDSLSTLERE
jgi:hypothetical protein